MLTNVVSYVLVALFLILQRLLRRGEQAKSLRPVRGDRATTRLLGIAYGLSLLALVVAPFLNAVEVARLELGPAAG
jgi:hypothetical protein